jgi:hypothetical protein
MVVSLGQLLGILLRTEGGNLIFGARWMLSNSPCRGTFFTTRGE